MPKNNRKKIYDPKYTALHDGIPTACCPLCNSKLDTDSLLHTTDYRILIRRKHVAELTAGEASIARALLKAHGTGFRVTREWLIETMYSGSNPPLSAGDVVNTLLGFMRKKLLALEMGLRVEQGVVTLLFFVKATGGRPRLVKEAV